jgi:DNA-binding CsgD family transcriptional regulator
LSALTVKLAEDLWSFARASTAAASLDDLLDELLVRVESCGVTHVAAAVTTDAQRNFKYGPRIGKLNMAWAGVYLGDKLYENDPIINYMLKGERCVSWREALDDMTLTGANRRVMDTARELGVKDGFVAPMPLFNGDVMVVGFQGESIDPDPEVGAFLRGMAFYYGSDGHRLLSRMKKTGRGGVNLTTRQTEVMRHTSEGKTAVEIAGILGISSRTVEFHRDQARARLDAANITEAAVIVNSMPDNLFRPS